MTSIDTREQSMWEELEASREQVEDNLHHWDAFQARYRGGYDSKADQSGHAPWNPTLEIMTTTIGKVIAGDPRVLCQPTRSDDPEIELRCAGMEFAVNSLCSRMHLKQTLRKVFVDRLHYPGYLWLERKRYPWVDPGPINGVVHRPIFKRVSPWLVRSDARATDWDETGMRAVGIVTNAKAILKAASEGQQGWYTRVIEGLRPNLGGDRDRDRLVPRIGQQLRNDDFILWIVWIPEEEISSRFTPERGFYGTLRFYAQTSVDKKAGSNESPLTQIRAPQPQFGSRHGPLFRFAGHYVPDRKETISTLLGVEKQTAAVGRVRDAIMAAMEAYKHFAVNGTGKKRLSDLIRDHPDLSVIDVPGFTGEEIKDLTVGGIDNQVSAQFEFVTDEWGRATGMNSTLAGQPRGNITATSDTLAAGAVSDRIELDRDMFYDDLRLALEGLAEMIDMDGQFYLPVPPDVQEQTGFMMQMVKGGRTEGQSFDDYAFTLCPLSMRTKDEQAMKQAAIDDIALYQQIAPLARQFPEFQWGKIMSDYARSVGRHHIPARWNPILAGQLAALAYAGALDPELAYARGPGDAIPFLVSKPEDRERFQPAYTKPQGAGQPGQGTEGTALAGGSLTDRRQKVGRRAGAQSGSIARLGQTGR